jgi:hypothetical protein
MNVYYEINTSLFNEYENQKRNYQLLKSIKYINFDNEIFKSLRNINEITNIKNYLQLLEQNSNELDEKI